MYQSKRQALHFYEIKPYRCVAICHASNSGLRPRRDKFRGIKASRGCSTFLILVRMFSPHKPLMSPELVMPLEQLVHLKLLVPFELLISLGQLAAYHQGRVKAEWLIFLTSRMMSSLPQISIKELPIF